MLRGSGTKARPGQGEPSDGSQTPTMYSPCSVPRFMETLHSTRCRSHTNEDPKPSFPGRKSGLASKPFVTQKKGPLVALLIGSSRPSARNPVLKSGCWPELGGRGSPKLRVGVPFSREQGLLVRPHLRISAILSHQMILHHFLIALLRRMQNQSLRPKATLPRVLPPKEMVSSVPSQR